MGGRGQDVGRGHQGDQEDVDRHHELVVVDLKLRSGDEDGGRTSCGEKGNITGLVKLCKGCNQEGPLCSNIAHNH